MTRGILPPQEYPQKKGTNMNRFKLLFLTTTLIFSSLLFAAGGGGGGGSKEDDASGASAAPVLAVLHGWLGHAALRQARELLAECLLEPNGETPQEAPEAPGTKYINEVEWLGSGIVIDRGLKITPKTTYQDLTQAVVAKLNDGTSPYNLLLFNGYGGDEITSTNFRNLEIQTLVVTRMTQEIYLARQKKVMKALYNLLPDGAKVGALARLENHPSTWIGAKEVSEEGFILKLCLSNKQLTGQIPSELGNLTKLQKLSLCWNQLTGPIPSELGQLNQLKTLFLFGNQLTGEIPKELGQLTELQNLYLEHNQLTGEIPTELGQLTELQKISLSRNKLTGAIPPKLGQLTKLQYLSLYNNQLTGPTPPELNRIGLTVYR